jgi:flagellar motor switch protein FliN/FliY
MTTTDQLLPQTDSAGYGQDLLIAAGLAVAELLPATRPLSPGTLQPGPLGAEGEWAGAAIAHLNGSTDSFVGVLVGQELVDALKDTPLGELDVADAVQPALDAAAAALGATAGAAQGLNPATLGPSLTATAAMIPMLSTDATDAVFFVVSPGAVAKKPAQGAAKRPGIELLHGVSMEVTVELGRTRMSVRELLALSPGDILELDRAAGSPADLLVNGRLIARGEVVVLDEDFALRVTEIVTDTTVS